MINKEQLKMFFKENKKKIYYGLGINCIYFQVVLFYLIFITYVHEYGHYFFGSIIYKIPGKVNIDLSKIFSLEKHDYIGLYTATGLVPTGTSFLDSKTISFGEVLISLGGILGELLFTICCIVLLFFIGSKSKYKNLIYYSSISFLILSILQSFYSNIILISTSNGTLTDGYFVHIYIKEILNH